MSRHKEKNWRRRHFEEQNGLCYFCEEEMIYVHAYNKNHQPSKRDCTLDHKHPSARGGKHTYKNTVAACWKCNHDKNYFSADEFLHRLKK